MTRAVVVDDSHFMRSVISDILDEGGINVVARAGDGKEAIAAVAEHEPDVVTMDVEMPVMNGIDAVDRIMDDNPTPVLMLSAYTDDRADATLRALEKGAVDVFAKPDGEVSVEISGQREDLVEKVKSVSQADASSVPAVETETVDKVEDEAIKPSTVIVGASTGGPSVVESVVSGLPESDDIRVLIVQHMPENFTKRFAKRLNRQAEYDIREASDGDVIRGGEGAVARAGHHMEVTEDDGGRLRIALSDEIREHGVRPAIDVTMETAADVVSHQLVGVVLTGMGSDGASGVESIHDAGGVTIAQDEETSSVFGIPARAIETGCIDEVRPASAIADEILEQVRTDR